MFVGSNVHVHVRFIDATSADSTSPCFQQDIEQITLKPEVQHLLGTRSMTSTSSPLLMPSSNGTVPFMGALQEPCQGSCALSPSPSSSQPSTTPSSGAPVRKRSVRCTVNPMDPVVEETEPDSQGSSPLPESSPSFFSNSRKSSTSISSCQFLQDHPIQQYILSLRPWTFSASFGPVALGAALAHKYYSTFDPVVFFMSCFTVIAVHAAGNLANTYHDYVNGIDQQSGKTEDRTLIDHRLTVDQLVNLGVLCYTMGCIGFVSLVFLSSARMEDLALIYFGGLSCSFMYTGGIGLKYIGLGDIIILIIFGPISILFSFLAQAGTIDLMVAVYALPLALNTEAIFHANNTRDIVEDTKAGAVTLAILIGPTLSYFLYGFLLLTPYLMFLGLALHHSYWFLLPVVTLPKAFNLEKKFRCGSLDSIPRETATLNLYFALLYVGACVLVPSHRLPLLSLVQVPQ